MILSNNRPSLNLYSQSKTLAFCLFFVLSPMSVIFGDGQSGTMRTSLEVASGAGHKDGYYNKTDDDHATFA